MNEIDEALQEIEAQEVGINFGLLARVADYVEANTQEFDMQSWGRNGGGRWNRLMVMLGISDPPYTVGCVACHTVRLGGGDECANIPAQAQRLLRISDDQALRLFYAGNWPKPYKREYETARAHTESRAWISAQRFRHFIETNGAE